MPDWYENALARVWRNRGWTLSYALFSGHFVDDFGNLILVYAADSDSSLY